MKLLFLDIDGVLNSEKWFRKNINNDKFTGLELDPTAVKLFNDFIDNHDVSVVISSSWRISSECVQRLKDNGVHTDKFIGRTVSLSSTDKIRGDEIDHWLRHHYNIDGYVILDDDSDFTDIQLEMHLVKTSWSTGLQQEHIDRIIEILNELDSNMV